MSLTAPQSSLGIDLGTSSLRIHRLDTEQDGLTSAPVPVSFPGSGQDGSMPMVMKLGTKGELLTFGRPALLEVPSASDDRFVFEFKPCIGQSPADLEAQGRPDEGSFCSNPNCPHPGWPWSTALRYCGFCGQKLQDAVQGWTPTFRYTQDEALQYARLLLKEVSKNLREQFNEPISKQDGWTIVAGVPVHWQDETRTKYQKVLREAFPQAAVDLLTEPAAALRCYSFESRRAVREGGTLIVDMGAGTTDLVLANVTVKHGQLHLEETAAWGERYGGSDFDMILAHHAASELRVALDGGLLLQWKQLARTWKEAFSAQMHQRSQSQVRCTFPVPQPSGFFDHRPVDLNRARFETIAADLIERFRCVLSRGLKHFGVENSDVDQVVLTGGGTQWYFVQEAVNQLFPKKVLSVGVDPERAISKGLAFAIAPLPRTRGRSDQPEPLPGEDVQVTVQLNQHEVAAGCTRVVTVSGRKEQIQVPPGLRDGQSFSLPGRGLPGQNGGPAGSLHVGVQVVSEPAAPPVRGEDVQVVAQLTQEEAANGCTRAVAVSGRKETIRIPAGTRNGQRLPFPGQGMPGQNGGAAGDLYVTLQVLAPPPPPVAVPVTVSDAEAASGCVRTVPVDGRPRSISVPSGVRDGQRVPIHGMGPKREDGTRGDLWLEIRVRAEPSARSTQPTPQSTTSTQSGTRQSQPAPTVPQPVRGADVQATVHITATQARQGANVMIRDRGIQVRLPAGVENGHVRRVPGRGKPGMNGGQPGDLILIVQITPDPPRKGLFF